MKDVLIAKVSDVYENIQNAYVPKVHRDKLPKINTSDEALVSHIMKAIAESWVEDESNFGTHQTDMYNYILDNEIAPDNLPESIAKNMYWIVTADTDDSTIAYDVTPVNYVDMPKFLYMTDEGKYNLRGVLVQGIEPNLHDYTESFNKALEELNPPTEQAVLTLTESLFNFDLIKEIK